MRGANTARAEGCKRTGAQWANSVGLTRHPWNNPSRMAALRQNGATTFKSTARSDDMIIEDTNRTIADGGWGCLSRGEASPPQQLGSPNPILIHR